SFAIFLTATSYCSERLLAPHEMPNLTEFSLRNHPQHNRYESRDLVITIKNGIHEGKEAYKEKKYSLAAMSFSGAARYFGVMDRELGEKLDQVDIDLAHYGIADCHLNHLNSTQHALESLRHIHDKPTYYGILKSEHIAQ